MSQSIKITLLMKRWYDLSRC